MAPTNPDSGPQPPINPEDIRSPGPGGGEQPAVNLETNRPLGEQPPHAAVRFDETGDTDSNGADAALAGSDPREGGAAVEEASITTKREYVRDAFGDDSYVLATGTELYNQSGARVVLRAPAAIMHAGATGDPRANDQRFAGFLHDSDKNWALNIGQLDRVFNRATATPLPLMCVKHGEDIEDAPYGNARPCPKCAAEKLAEAATIAPVLQEPDSPVESPIKEGDVVVCTLPDSVHAGVEMTVISVEYGIANCNWFEDGQLQEKTFGVSVLRKVR